MPFLTFESKKWNISSFPFKWSHSAPIKFRSSQTVVTQSTKSCPVIIIHSWDSPIKTEKKCGRLNLTQQQHWQNTIGTRCLFSNLIYTLFLSGLLFAVEAACLAHILIVPPCHALGIGENYPLRLIGYHYVFLYFEERKIQQHAIGWGKNDSSKFSRQTQGFFSDTAWIKCGMCE